MEWAPALVTAAVALLGWAVTWGTLTRAVKDHDQQFDAVETEQNEQWGKINRTAEDVAKIKGRIGLKSDSGVYSRQ